MSWFTNVFGPVLRLFGVGKKKDKPIPSPLPGSERIMLTLFPANSTEARLVEEEAVSAIRGYVRAPYQLHDREIRILALSFDAAKTHFVSRGNQESNWPKNRIGMAYAPKVGFNANYGLVHLVLGKRDQPERVWLAVHEYGHLLWHFLLTDGEWTQWQAKGWEYEEFADDFYRRMNGSKLDTKKVRFFERLETRLAATGTKSLRM